MLRTNECGPWISSMAPIIYFLRTTIYNFLLCFSLCYLWNNCTHHSVTFKKPEILQSLLIICKVFASEQRWSMWKKKAQSMAVLIMRNKNRHCQLFKAPRGFASTSFTSSFSSGVQKFILHSLLLRVKSIDIVTLIIMFKSVLNILSSPCRSLLVSSMQATDDCSNMLATTAIERSFLM